MYIYHNKQQIHYKITKFNNYNFHKVTTFRGMFQLASTTCRFLSIIFECVTDSICLPHRGKKALSNAAICPSVRPSIPPSVCPIPRAQQRCILGLCLLQYTNRKPHTGSLAPTCQRGHTANTTTKLHKHSLGSCTTSGLF